ncbi:MAG: membrane-bound lytic murein transglycosylase MltF [Gammaproteobacteria bacterium]
MPPSPVTSGRWTLASASYVPLEPPAEPRTAACRALRYLTLVGWAATIAGLTACSTDHSAHSPQAIQARGELIVLTRNAPTTYYDAHDTPTGPEYDMARAFARYLGVKAKFVVLDSTAEVLQALRDGRGDLAAAGLTRTRQRHDDFRFGPTYQTVRQQVVCRRGGAHPTSVTDLTEVPFTVAADSSYVERLATLQRTYPKLHWHTDLELSSEDLLEQVWQRKLPCTVADSNIVAINRRYFPELVVAFDLSKPQDLAWALPRDARGLQTAVTKWFSGYQSSGALRPVMNKYYGYVKLFDYVGTRTFLRRIHSRLPRFRGLFQQAARSTRLNWVLLAVQSYQESRWNARAISPTGVRGMMMLTRHTARAVGVTNRLNPQQSIRGGARDLAELRARLPKNIREPDRTWFALAAYNIGFGHIQDARALARRLGHPANRWSGLSQVLPLLARQRYYRTLPHGYARGNEPVQYVNRIRDYENILARTLELRRAGARVQPPAPGLAGSWHLDRGNSILGM